MHALKPNPNRLGARRIGSFPIHIPAELRHQSHEDAQGGRLGGRVLPTDHLPDRFPLRRLEDHLATRLRTTPPRRHTYSVRQATIMYIARHVNKRSMYSNSRSSTRQPDFNTRKKISIIHRTQ